ncbi:N-acetyltransferase family protein [Colwelliaceae bacterium 6471]
MNIAIRKPKLTDRSVWKELWHQYLVFYKSADFQEELTELLWQRIHTVENPINCLVAQCIESGKLLAFVHYLPHADTWQKFPVCYIQDLFVSPQARGNGMGEQLIKTVIERAKELGWQDVYWQTQYDNDLARGLYDKLTGGTDGYVTYRLPTISKL